MSARLFKIILTKLKDEHKKSKLIKNCFILKVILMKDKFGFMVRLLNVKGSNCQNFIQIRHSQFKINFQRVKFPRMCN